MASVDPIKLVLAVLDPEYAQGTDITVLARDKRLLKSSVREAERNGLYYYFMSKLKELNLDLAFEDEKRWQEENRRLEELKRTITFLNDISEDCGVRYIWIKSCNPIPHIPRDVDIFVRKEDKGRLAATLQKEGLSYDQPSKVQVLLEKQGVLRVDIYMEICYFKIKFITISENTPQLAVGMNRRMEWHAASLRRCKTNSSDEGVRIRATDASQLVGR